MTHSDPPIDAYPFIDYTDPAVAFKPYDPRFPEVADALIALIARCVDTADSLEHIGSTAVPNCAGKGVIDLMLVYASGELTRTAAAVDALGFQAFSSARQPFPEERPVRIGSFLHGAERYRVHLHLIPAGSSEIETQRRFRDTLRSDPALLEAYVSSKREALRSGVRDSTDYNRAKEAVINRVLDRE